MLRRHVVTVQVTGHNPAHVPLNMGLSIPIRNIFSMNYIFIDNVECTLLFRITDVTRSTATSTLMQLRSSNRIANCDTTT